MTPDRKAELERLGVIKKGSQISPERAKCGRCLRMFEVGELYEGLCEKCTPIAKNEQSQSALRAIAFERDKGVCAECHEDTVAIREELDGLKTMNPKKFTTRVHYFARLGFERGALLNGDTLWNAAHLKARVEGGANDPSNIVTLCVRCHSKDTKALASRRANSRGRFGR